MMVEALPYGGIGAGFGAIVGTALPAWNGEREIKDLLKTGALGATAGFMIGESIGTVLVNHRNRGPGVLFTPLTVATGAGALVIKDLVTKTTDPKTVMNSAAIGGLVGLVIGIVTDGVIYIRNGPTTMA